MALPHDPQEVTEIQILSLLPDLNICDQSSEISKVLVSGLTAASTHPKCSVIYVLTNIEKPQDIAIISKWIEAVDSKVSRSYLPDMLTYLESPPARSIHVDDALGALSRYNISSFRTIYFPTAKWTTYLQTEIVAILEAFVNASCHMYGHTDPQRVVSWGWIKDSQVTDGQQATGLVLCSNWIDREAEEEFKTENSRWRTLMLNIRAMGVLREDEWHGMTARVFRDVSKEPLGTDDIDEDIDGDAKDKFLEEQLKRLRALAHSSRGDVCVDKFISCRGMGDPLPPFVEVNKARLESLCAMETYSRNCQPPDEDQNSLGLDSNQWDTGLEESDDEDPESPAIFTPSSSTMSLASLVDDSKLVRTLPGTWKSEYDISATSDLPGIVSGIDQNMTMVLPRGKYQYEFSSDDEDDESDLDLSSSEQMKEELKSLSASSTGPVQDLSSSAFGRHDANMESDSSKRVLNFDGGQTIPALMRQYGVPKLNPDEELRNANLRFKRHGMRLSAIRLDAQRAIIRELPPQKVSIEVIPTNQPSRIVEKAKVPWLAFLRNLLSAGSKLDLDSELEKGITTTESIPVHAATTCVARRHGSSATRYLRDTPMSVQ